MDRGPAGGPPERHLASSVSIILASGDGWCQTLFLVLTCRLGNQKQRLTPGTIGGRAMDITQELPWKPGPPDS